MEVREGGKWNGVGGTEVGEVREEGQEREARRRRKGRRGGGERGGISGRKKRQKKLERRRREGTGRERGQRKEGKGKNRTLTPGSLRRNSEAPRDLSLAHSRLTSQPSGFFLNSRSER